MAKAKHRGNHDNGINLGDLVRDRVSDHRGVVLARTHWRNNVNRLSLQPLKLKEGRPQQTRDFDETDLELVERGFTVAIPPTFVPDVDLGDQVEDRVTGYEGTIVAITTWSNGCIRVIVQAKETKGELPPPQQLDAQDVKLVKRAVHPPGLAATGGPRMTVERR